MVKLSEMVSDALSGTGKNVVIRRKCYTVYPPTPYVLNRMLKPLLNIDVNMEDSSISSVIENTTRNTTFINQCIAWAIIGDREISPWIRIRFRNLCRKLERITEEERTGIFKTIISLIDVQNFFLCARLAMGLTSLLAKQKLSEEIH